MEELSFAGRKMKLDNAIDAKEIVEGIKNFKNLKALRLEGNTLGLEAAKVIADALKDKPEFERALWSDMYTGRLRSEIPPSLEHLGYGIISAKAKLSTLDLSDNAFGPDGVKGIRKLLTSESCYSLKTLKLNNNGLGIGGGKILSEAFIECYNTSKAAGTPFALKVFISGRNRLEDPGAKALSEAFKILGSLEEITMPQNGIRPTGVTDLASAFKENKNLKIVNINDNTCTESGAKAIAESLLHLKNLEVLNVGDCLLKDRGALVLAPALAAEMPSLKEVIMSFNEIRSEGALAVTKSMKNKTSLKLLNLDGNQLGDSTDDIEELMTSFGRIDVLAPFDENEEPDSEDDEDDEENEDNTGSIKNKQTEDLSLCIKGMGLSNDSPLLKSSTEVHKQLWTVEDVHMFLEKPSLKSWKNVSPASRKNLFKTAFEEDILPSPEKVAKIFTQTCSALSTDPEAVKEFSELLFESAFTDVRCSQMELTTYLFIYMGLLKGETKIEQIQQLSGPLTGLKEIILQEYFPKTLTAFFIAFLTKPNTLLDACQKERHQLLQVLYQK